MEQKYADFYPFHCHFCSHHGPKLSYELSLEDNVFDWGVVCAFPLCVQRLEMSVMGFQSSLRRCGWDLWVNQSSTRVLKTWSYSSISAVKGAYLEQCRENAKAAINLCQQCQRWGDCFLWSWGENTSSSSSVTHQLKSEFTTNAFSSAAGTRLDVAFEHFLSLFEMLGRQSQLLEIFLQRPFDSYCRYL